MTINIENEVDYQFDFDYETLIRLVIYGAVEYVHCPYDTEIDVVLTDNENIRVTNREFRSIDKATDVLSFPMVEFQTLEDFSEIPDEAFDPDLGELVLGSIMISVERAKEQSELYGHSFQRELAFLVAHSMFHLFGYDHETDEEREVMEEKQRDLLNRLHILR